MIRGYLSFLILLMSSPFLTLLIHAVCTRILRKVRPEVSPLPVAVLAVFFGYPVVSYSAWQCHLKFIWPGEWVWPIVYAFIVYSCLSFCYFILFTMSETARRIHILRRLHEKGAVSTKELAAEYGATDMLFLRLERMVALKQLKCIQGRYFLNARLLCRIGEAVAAWAKLLRFKRANTP